MYNPNPNDDLQRHVRNTADPYNAHATGSSGRGGLIALLVIVAVIGGIIVLSMMGEPPAQAPTSETGAPAPESITGGTTPAE